MPFEIKVENLDEIRETFRTYPKIADEEIHKGLLESGKLIVKAEKEEAPVGNTAHLRQSIGMKIGNNSITIVPKKEYAIAVHEGTSPHFVSVKNARDPLRLWAIKKGLNPYAIQKSIAKKGTKANPFVDRTIKKVNDKVRNVFVKVLEKIIKRI